MLCGPAGVLSQVQFQERGKCVDALRANVSSFDTFDGIAGRYTNRDHSLSVEGAAWKIAGAKSIEPL